MLNQADIDKIKELIISAGSLAALHQESELKIEIKKDDSPVTNIDRLLSSYIIDHLGKIVPNVPIISEEDEDIAEGGDTFFLVDPIDGTRSYIKGEDSYTVNIGLIEDGVPTYGFIYQPSKKLLHYTDATKTLVVEMDGREIAAGSLGHHDEGCIIAISNRKANSEQIHDFIKSNNGAVVVRVSSSIKLCMISDGSAHLYPCFGETMEWDIAAGHALILAAGGDVVTMEGKRVRYGKPGLRNNHFVAYGNGRASFF